MITTFFRRHGLLVSAMAITAVALAAFTLTRHLRSGWIEETLQWSLSLVGMPCAPEP